MKCFEIQPVLSSALPDVASFLRRWRADQIQGSSVRDPLCEDPMSIERRLRWLLVENPVTNYTTQHGFCIRDHQGIIRGLTLSFPAAFLAGDRRRLGLSSGSFFVEPQARTLGYYLFKKYMSTPGYSFFFATTCNANSGALWEKLGGAAVPKSDVEYILPLRLDIALPAFVAKRTSSKVASGLTRIFGRCANPMLQLLAQRSAGLTIEPCEDWQRLSDLFRRHRPHDWIVSDRSADFLRWRYGPTSPYFPCDIYLFRDKRGNEGWFSLGNLMRGNFRGSVLLDAIWPREQMSFRDIFREILRLAATEGDAIFLRPQPGLDYCDFSPWVIRRRLEAPRVFLITPKGDPLLAVDSLDYDDSDYGAWEVHYRRVPEPLLVPRSFGSGVKPARNSEA